MNEIIQAILNTRDMCGNEFQAAKEAAADYGIPFNIDVYRQALSMANGQWRKSQQAAGVPAKYWAY